MSNTRKPFCSKEELYDLYVTQGMSYKKIIEKYKINSRRVLRLLKLYGITSRKKFSLIDLSGQRFGKLVAVKFVPKEKREGAKNKTTTAHWFCKCDCGRTKVVRTSSLKKGYTQSCGLCIRYKGINDLSGIYLRKIKNGAKIRNLEFKVSDQYLWDLFVKQDKKCNLSGVTITLERFFTGYKVKQTASLDRIDNDRGYIKGNLHWVHKEINILRGKMKLDRFISICKEVSKHC